METTTYPYGAGKPPTFSWLFWLGVIAATLVFIYFIKSVLLPFVVGFLIAYFFDPLVDKLEKRNINRGNATFLVLAGFFLVLTLAVFLLVPLIVEQITGLVQAIPGYVEDIQRKHRALFETLKGYVAQTPLEDAKDKLADNSDTLFAVAGNVMQKIFDSGMALFNFLSLIFVSPIVAFYLLRDWDVLVAKVDDMLPRTHVATIREQMRIIDRTLSGFIRGQTNVCLFLGTFYGIGLTLCGLNFGLIIGLISGILTFIPYVGALFGFVVGITVAFFQFGSDWTSIGLVALVFGIGQFLEGNIVAPRLVGDKVGLHPAWLIFGMLAGGALFGFTGILLAVPVTAVIGVLVRFFIGKYMQSAYYFGEPHFPVPPVLTPEGHKVEKGKIIPQPAAVVLPDEPKPTDEKK
jgi:predicted PurR-regulated permease PerM